MYKRQHLNNVNIKAEALREAQLAMLRGEVVITNDQLKRGRTSSSIILTLALAKIQYQNLPHPFYWAGFTIVGSPW